MVEQWRADAARTAPQTAAIVLGFRRAVKRGAAGGRCIGRDTVKAHAARSRDGLRGLKAPTLPTQC